VLIGFQLLFWTLIPLFSHHAPPLDATEMYGWSLSFEWGFYKHPPMPTWIVAIVQAIVGKNLFSLFLSGSLAICFTYYAVAWMANQFLEEKEAIVALFLYSLVIYCHLWSTDFNHNQIQMPFWAWSLVFLYLTLQTKSHLNAVLLGVLMGLNALSKYTAALIVPSALLLIFFSTYWRKQFQWQQLVLASVGFSIIFSPHLWWLIHHDFMPLHYVSERIDELDKESSNLLLLLDFIGNTLIAHLFLWIILIWCLVKKQRVIPHSLPANNQDGLLSKQQFLLFIGLGPFVLSCILGLWVPLYHRWVTPMLPLLTIAVAFFMRGRFAYFYKRKFLIAFFLIQLVFGSIYFGKAYLNKNSARGNFPAPEITKIINENWQRLFPNSPLRIVAGGEWEAGFVSLFSTGKYMYLLKQIIK
jgi:4-amino-4-deoxy-L-arabinose transferase-like glycosyltransferase